ncbi:histidinol dehydrogenase, partial [Devosia sp.]|uniref:histidinol dehydrogenase n=1 Tax=Devosia sp. TaxID=1871048 RepID=UPI002FC94057
MSDVSFYDYAKLSTEQRAALLKRSEADLSGVIEKVKPIIEAVRTEGDAALARFARDFDKAENVTEATLQVTLAEFDAAFKAVDSKVV